ncbi:MAG: ketopantoate reductase family protein [Desulfovermiculus sp.]|nr:ketopantoate reductase family protein [Desulfovermiculus sp.]
MQDAKVCIVGPGAMGSFYYWKFHQAGFEQTALLAGGERAQRLQNKGILINGQSIPARVVTPENTDYAADLIIVAVKYHHLDQVVAEMKNLVAENTLIISVMNGIDSEEILARTYGWDQVLYAIALGIDAQREPNQIRVTNQGTVYFGEQRNPELSPRVKRVEELFQAADIAYQIPEDMIRVMWWKYMINVGVNQVSAVLRAPFGTFQKSPEARDLMQEAMQEVIDVAGAKDIQLGAGDIQSWLQVMETLDPEGKTSMCQDVLAGRKTEVEMFAGILLHMGRDLNVPTPLNRYLFQFLKAIEQDMGADAK